MSRKYPKTGTESLIFCMSLRLLLGVTREVFSPKLWSAVIGNKLAETKFGKRTSKYYWPSAPNK
jgi:hypothetical protein